MRILNPQRSICAGVRACDYAYSSEIIHLKRKHRLRRYGKFIKSPALCICVCVIPVIVYAQNWEIINTAVLTGKQISHAMKVFVVSYAGKISDVTRQSVCQIEDDSVLKVIYTRIAIYSVSRRRDIHPKYLLIFGFWVFAIVTGHVVLQFGVRGRFGNQRLVQRHGDRQVRDVHGNGALRRVGTGNQRDGLDDRGPEAEPDQRLARAGQSGSRRRDGRVS